MNWLNLLSDKRINSKSNASNPVRSNFEQDYDRLIFSHPFRKLQDKTQVFPLPEDDFVHNRLTHSLEVSSVGRSLGKNAGEFLLKKYPKLAEKYTIHDFGAIVGAACLAHDLGNPPFGHSGEDCISSFFLTNPNGLIFKEKVSSEEWEDLTTFEGNAQGFRLLCSQAGGLKLTYATLGTFMKYPISSSSKKDKAKKSQKKYGYFQSNVSLFSEIADELGLIKYNETTWSRHPLVFLVEAADDICYQIIDLEDGCRLGLAPFEGFVKDKFAAIIGANFKEDKLEQHQSLNEKLSVMRAMAIGKLIAECSQAFERLEEAILNGTFDKSLLSEIPSSGILKEIETFSIKNLYQSKLVREKEAGGFRVIEMLMENFCDAAYAKCKNELKPIQKSVINLLPEEYLVQLNSKLSTYQILQIVVDFISGMTDSHAVRLYRTINGSRL